MELLCEKEYVVKQTCKAHVNDVRAIKTVERPFLGFVTGSRDCFVKLWKSERESYLCSHVYLDATKFVSSLCVLHPSKVYPDGLLLVGSHDCSIYGYTLNSNRPILRLHNHTGPVCCLTAGSGVFVSGSWDKTAVVWCGQYIKHILSGHEEAVWSCAVYPINNLILTASADKTIRVWQDGMCQKVFYGHTDCVRDLVVTADHSILSCSNDTTVRMWDIQGNCLKVFESHTNFIYSVALMSNGRDFVTCSEDQTIKIWVNGQCIQTLEFAGKTLWSLACLANNQIVVAASDGSAYVLEQKDSKKVDAEEKLKPVEFSDPSVIVKEKDFKLFIEAGFGGEVQPLEFNKDENPYDVAKTFIALHEKDVGCLQEIVGTIVLNTGMKPPPLSNQHFPVNKYWTYISRNLEGLKAKLLEFNGIVPLHMQIPQLAIEKLVGIVSDLEPICEEGMQSLEKVIHWDDEHLFPVLDLLRIAALNQNLCSKIANEELLNHLLGISRQTKKSVNSVLIVKILCNLSGFVQGDELLVKFQARILDFVMNLYASDVKSHKSVSCLLLNYAVGVYKCLPLDFNTVSECLKEVLATTDDSECINRVLLGIGTLCVSDYRAFLKFRSINLNEALSIHMGKDKTQLNELLTLIKPSFTV